MTTYFIVPDGVLIGDTLVPADLRDPRYVAYLQEIDPEFDLQAAMVRGLTDAVQEALDAAARSIGYDDIKTAITYRGDSNPKFAAEAEAFFAWRSAVWTQAYAHLALVQAGQAPMPTAEEAIAMMPVLELPQ